ncbi:Holliday junction resolvase RecU [Mycoplasma sp. NEAQ87857]|uniref:Holliday junction resolvase RecU n=1 Tax=Mycoplasma sp. NEAQ87857 TaxID=2683967 RepID=UPI001315D089|nr:Holliday junction resolvase RecU [Mycoplasma sp. NEAQ87857]QGZ97749.1 Holliday junction resolvase RecU [Mycoplasma sp. NEAQ87857]
MQSNRGMFLEKIINNTIDYFWSCNIAFIEKKSLPISFYSVKTINNKKVLSNSYISKKSTVDYIGMYKGKFICFEAKSTNDKFLEKQNFQKHQLDYLDLIDKNNGISFVIVYFSLYNVFLKVNIQLLLNEFNNCSRIPYEKLKKNSKLLILEFPGYINFLN